MLKKILISLAAVAIVAQPVIPSVAQADSGSWSNIQATEAWVYDDYKVERLDFGTNDFNGPLSLGDNVVVAKVAGNCVSRVGCERYDLYVLRNGLAMFVGNVPHEVVDESRFLNNDNRLVYVNSADQETNTRWNVISMDLQTGNETVDPDNVFIDGVQDIDAMKDNNDYFFNVSLNWNDHSGYTNAVIYKYDQPSDSVKMIVNQWNQNRDELQDVQNGNVLSKMVFESGYKQLWVINTKADPVTMEAVPNTWTPKNEDIVGAHFRADGKVEFFDMYQRFIYDGTTTVAQGENLSWTHSREEALQVVDGRMAWLDSDDVLHVSGADVDLDLGKIGSPDTFKLTKDSIFYSSGMEGKKYDFATKITTTYPFAITDTLNDLAVGEDASGNIWYLNTESGRKISLGFGSKAVISDDMHVYWLGVDGGVFEATLSLNALSGASDISAVKVSGSPIVYLILDETIYSMPSEKVYFSWFENWEAVKTVSASYLNSFKNGGAATYAPGSLFKMSGDPKVYMVGSDGKFHWITTQLVAYNIFGETWNKDIIEFNTADATGIIFGSSIDSAAEIQNI